MSDALIWHTERARSIRANREVGAAIRFARENRGWRLADLAAQVGYSVSTISRLETSRREPTDLAQIRRIAAAVGLDRAAGQVPRLLVHRVDDEDPSFRVSQERRRGHALAR